MSSRSNIWIAFLVVWLVIIGGGAAAYKLIIEPWLVSRPDNSLQAGTVLRVPYILWGGDIATFHANGGKTTQKGTQFHNHGLNIELVRHPGDNFDLQIQEYLSGKSHFLRGTMSMLGQASETIGKEDPGKQMVVFLQMTWSAGDHMVARSNIQTLSDLKGKTIVLQQGGPHVGMLKDILTTAGFSWSKDPNGNVVGDIRVIWKTDITGPNGPAEAFRADPKIDACFAITPDMISLAGGIDKKGDGKEKTVPGAHVLVSTQHMSRSIADVYACRKDFFEKHKDVIEKFTAAYLKACEEVKAMTKSKQAAEYKTLTKMAQDIYGPDECPDFATADGLIEDAFLVGLPGNRNFFTLKGNLSGFDAKMNAALDVAIDLGDAKRRFPFEQANLDYNKIKELGKLTATATEKQAFKKVDFLPEGTIFSFDIKFPPKGAKFDRQNFGKHFQRALEQASVFGNAAIQLRGHTDPISVLAEFARYGKHGEFLKPAAGAQPLPLKKYDNNKLDPTNPNEEVEYTEFYDRYAFTNPLGGVEILDFTQKATAKRIVTLLKEGKNLGAAKYEAQAKLQMNKMIKLSRDRAVDAREAVIEYANDNGIRLDESQITDPEGVGVAEPIIPLPLPGQPTDLNRRVEFRIVRVNVEALDRGDWDR